MSVSREQQSQMTAEELCGTWQQLMRPLLSEDALGKVLENWSELSPKGTEMKEGWRLEHLPGSGQENISIYLDGSLDPPMPNSTNSDPLCRWWPPGPHRSLSAALPVSSKSHLRVSPLCPLPVGVLTAWTSVLIPHSIHSHPLSQHADAMLMTPKLSFLKFKLIYPIMYEMFL